MNNLDPQTFFLDFPLYAPIIITKENVSDFKKLMSFCSKIDGYNPFINDQTTFICDGSSGDADWFITYGGMTKRKLTCLRSEGVFSFFLYFDNENQKFFKIGQYPSIADLHISQIKNYNKVLSREKQKEFTRAIGLAANGVGIGSFVYLRRIFEGLIEEAHTRALKEQCWDEENYCQKQMVEKIELLKSFLPSFLVENRNLYGILSVGIHSLEEADCLAHFEAVKVGIELILDEKLEILKKNQKIEDAKHKLADVLTKVTKR